MVTLENQEIKMGEKLMLVALKGKKGKKEQKMKWKLLPGSSFILFCYFSICVFWLKNGVEEKREKWREEKRREEWDKNENVEFEIPPRILGMSLETI